MSNNKTEENIGTICCCSQRKGKATWAIRQDERRWWVHLILSCQIRNNLDLKILIPSRLSSHPHQLLYPNYPLPSFTSTLTTMPDTLTVSPTLTPFPWGAVSIASFTQKAELVFDPSVSSPVLSFGGSTVTEEDEIVRVLAKAAVWRGGAQRNLSPEDRCRAQGKAICRCSYP